MIIKNRVKDAETHKLLGYERVNSESGQWEQLRVKRKEWLLGCITSEDNIIVEPYIGLNDLKDSEIYLNDKVKHYYNNTYGWRNGVISYDEALHSFVWNCTLSSGDVITKVLSDIDITTEKFELI